MKRLGYNSNDAGRKVKAEDRLIMIGERYKARQRQMREELLKRQKQEEELILNKQKRFHRGSISESQVETRFNNYLQHYKCKQRERIISNQEKELLAMQSPAINPLSEKLATKMNVSKYESHREVRR